ncbi:MAG: heme exporter protein CcmD [Rhodospirillaceae bacterium]|nr:heme exporter protein CcmD [Rhodospirillaceae bacterium]MBT6136597.1 heme exporter protein CcmD [Rhodospirillaceae bacterium]
MNMGGYGAFIWPAYGIVAIVMAGLLVAAVRGTRARARDLAALEATGVSRRGNPPQSKGSDGDDA